MGVDIVDKRSSEGSGRDNEHDHVGDEKRRLSAQSDDPYRCGLTTVKRQSPFDGPARHAPTTDGIAHPGGFCDLSVQRCDKIYFALRSRPVRHRRGFRRVRCIGVLNLVCPQRLRRRPRQMDASPSVNEMDRHRLRNDQRGQHLLDT